MESEVQYICVCCLGTDLTFQWQNNVLLFWVFYAPVPPSWCSWALSGTLPLFRSLRSVGLFLAGHGLVAGYERWHLQLHMSRSSYFTILSLCPSTFRFCDPFIHFLHFQLAMGVAQVSCEATRLLFCSLSLCYMYWVSLSCSELAALSCWVPGYQSSHGAVQEAECVMFQVQHPTTASLLCHSQGRSRVGTTSSHTWSPKLWATAAWGFSFPNCRAWGSTDPTGKIIASWKITFQFGFPVFGLNFSYVLELNSFS